MNVISPTYNGKINSSLLTKSVKLSDYQGAKVISPIDGKVENFTNTEIEIVGNIDGIEYKVNFENLGKTIFKDIVKQGETIGYVGSEEVTITVYQNDSKMDANKFFTLKSKSEENKEKKPSKIDNTKLKITDTDLDNMPELKLLSKSVLAPFSFLHSAITNKTEPTGVTNIWGKNYGNSSKTVNEEVERIKKLMK